MSPWQDEKFSVPKWEGQTPDLETYRDEVRASFDAVVETPECEHCGIPHKAWVACDEAKAVRAKLLDGFAPREQDVPWKVQEWCFDELAEEKLDGLREVIGDLWDDIIIMARQRFEQGYVTYGSRAFNWTPEERLRNVLEELADAVVYCVTGPLP